MKCVENPKTNDRYFYKVIGKKAYVFSIFVDFKNVDLVNLSCMGFGQYDSINLTDEEEDYSEEQAIELMLKKNKDLKEITSNDITWRKEINGQYVANLSERFKTKKIKDLLQEFLKTID